MDTHRPKAKQFNPNGLTLTRVARYERVIRAPLERVWENVLDWEHLPHLHATSFSHVELDAAGEWGWRTWSDPAHSGFVELCIATGDSYVARSYQGQKQTTEIWTTLTSQVDDTAIVVEFYLPDVAEDSVEGLGAMMLSLYTRLWDEDEEMMRERHRRLLEKRDTADTIDLGKKDALLERLAQGEQVIFQLRRREYQLRLKTGELLAHPTICPHLLGPLADCSLDQGRITCPWHGYEFDLATGACLSPPNATCKLPSNAQLRESNGNIIAIVGSDNSSI